MNLIDLLNIVEVEENHEIYEQIVNARYESKKIPMREFGSETFALPTIKHYQERVVENLKNNILKEGLMPLLVKKSLRKEGDDIVFVFDTISFPTNYESSSENEKRIKEQKDGLDLENTRVTINELTLLKDKIVGEEFLIVQNGKEEWFLLEDIRINNTKNFLIFEFAYLNPDLPNINIEINNTGAVQLVNNGIYKGKDIIIESEGYKEENNNEKVSKEEAFEIY